jgi:hypothetical protein
MIRNTRDMERKSSAITLSDMEIFIFPEIMYSLVLANIMSPLIWAWRDDPWFAGMERMTPYQRISRLKQYIMNNYVFNLDLDTWGLTTKERELARFSDFISEETLSQSNALFGYEGDKYYFKIDIRTHFGLDKYKGNVIPYWKTETVEAMDAFRYKPGYKTGAGECVSLATLYAAALFIVARIPLRDIYLMATPLHSQNFVDVDDGILTNNRRLVTKAMWYNGTAISAQARRALENERITVVSHLTGFIHTIYEGATIDEKAYDHFTERLKGFLKIRLSDEIIDNFLRHTSDMQKCFQVRWPVHGADHYIEAEKAFAYEYDSPYMLSNKTRAKLLSQIDSEEFQKAPLPRRIIMNDLEDWVRENDVDCKNPDDLERVKKQFASDCLESQVAIENLARFCTVEPRLPDLKAKEFIFSQEPLGIDSGMSREEIIDRLDGIRAKNDTADLAFYAYRDLNRTDTLPFILAATQRNPVSIEDMKELDADAVMHRINEMPDESIYEEPGRLAQPDEVWNYKRGDGAEKAILLANIIHNRRPGDAIEMKVIDDKVTLEAGGKSYDFKSRKGLLEQTWKV